MFCKTILEANCLRVEKIIRVVEHAFVEEFLLRSLKLRKINHEELLRTEFIQCMFSSIPLSARLVKQIASINF